MSGHSGKRKRCISSSTTTTTTTTTSESESSRGWCPVAPSDLSLSSDESEEQTVIVISSESDGMDAGEDSDFVQEGEEEDNVDNSSSDMLVPLNAHERLRRELWPDEVEQDLEADEDMEMKDVDSSSEEDEEGDEPVVATGIQLQKDPNKPGIAFETENGRYCKECHKSFLWKDKKTRRRGKYCMGCYIEYEKEFALLKFCNVCRVWIAVTGWAAHIITKKHKQIKKPIKANKVRATDSGLVERSWDSQWFKVSIYLCFYFSILLCTITDVWYTRKKNRPGSCSSS